MEKKYDDSGVLFFNTPERKTNPHQPDYSGGLDISPGLLHHLIAAHKSGQPLKVDLAGWVKQGKSGKKFLSLKVSPAWKPGDGRRSEPGQAQPSAQSGGFEADDDIPF